MVNRGASLLEAPSAVELRQLVVVRAEEELPLAGGLDVGGAFFTCANMIKATAASPSLRSSTSLDILQGFTVRAGLGSAEAVASRVLR